MPCDIIVLSDISREGMKPVLVRFPDEGLVAEIGGWANRHGRSRNMEIMAAVSEWVRRSRAAAGREGAVCSECGYWARYPDFARTRRLNLPFGRCDCAGSMHKDNSQGGFFVACEQFAARKEAWVPEEGKDDQSQ